MAKYGTFRYGTTPYGATALSDLSVMPMNLVVINFDEVYVSWRLPTGSISGIRLVRNQVGFPQTEEDGVVVWEQFSSDGSSLNGLYTTNIFKDGEDTPLPGVPPVHTGAEVFYTMFVFTSARVWVVAGETSGLIPSDHSSQQKMMELLPKVFTTKEQSPLGVVDTTSDLYAFLGGVAFTYDEVLTSLELLQPSVGWSTFPSSMLIPTAFDLGLTAEVMLPIQNQKALVREAHYMYNHKGLPLGIRTYVESLTGYSPTITVSPNLLLSVQDSTFYGSTGNWVATNATLSSSTTVVPPTTTNQIDAADACKIIASAPGAMTLGLDDVVGKAVPITASTQYTASLQLNSPLSAGTITLSIRFYDMFGVATSAAHSSGTISATATWASASVTATSDATSVYAVLTVAYSAAGTYYVDQVCVNLGATVTYDEARAISVVLAPSKINLIYNPSVEVDLTSWTFTGAPTVTRDSTTVPVAAFSASGYCMKIVSASAFTVSSNYALASAHGITVNESYVGSVYLKNSAALTLLVVSRDSGGAVLSSTSVAVPINADWTRYQIPFVIDASMTSLYSLNIEVDSAGANTVYLDCAQLELGHKATDYFDGSMPPAFGTLWAGAANGSASYQYTDKLVKIPRLAATLSDWVPSNMFWRIATLVAQEFTNLS